MQPSPRKSCPVFVMMPLDTVYVRSTSDGGSISDVQTPDALHDALDKIMQARVQVSTVAAVRTHCGASACQQPARSFFIAERRTSRRLRRLAWGTYS